MLKLRHVKILFCAYILTVHMGFMESSRVSCFSVGVAHGGQSPEKVFCFQYLSWLGIDVYMYTYIFCHFFM